MLRAPGSAKAPLKPRSLCHSASVCLGSMKTRKRLSFFQDYSDEPEGVGQFYLPGSRIRKPHRDLLTSNKLLEIVEGLKQ